VVPPGGREKNFRRRYRGGKRSAFEGKKLTALFGWKEIDRYLTGLGKNQAKIALSRKKPIPEDRTREDLGFTGYPVRNTVRARS